MNPNPYAFDEQAYLAANPDVADAVRRGEFTNGAQHFQYYGYRENRPGSPVANELQYINANPFAINSAYVGPFAQRILQAGGGFNEGLFTSDAANIQNALRIAQLRSEQPTQLSYRYIADPSVGSFNDSGGPVPDSTIKTIAENAAPKLYFKDVQGFSPRDLAYAEALVGATAVPYAEGDPRLQRDLYGQGAAAALRAGGFSASDIQKLMQTQNANEIFGGRGVDDVIAEDAFQAYAGLRPDLKADSGSFGDFIKDAFKSPVGAAILAGLTGGLGGLGAIGSGLAGAVGGTLSGAAASALGGAAIGGLGAGLRGDNIIKGAALGGVGGGLAGSGLGNATLGQTGGAALRGGLLGGASSALSGGDVLQGLLGGAVQGGVTSGLNQLGGAIKGGLLGNAFNGGIDFNDIEPNSFPPSEGDTFDDQTDYLALTPDNLRIRAEYVINNPESTPAQIDQAINEYQRAVELAQMASPFNTEGAYRVDIKGVGQELPQLPFSFGGLLSDQETAGIGASGGAGGFQQVPNVVRPNTQPMGGLLSDLTPISDQGEIARPPVAQITANNQGLNLNLGALLGLLGGGAALGGLLGDSGGSGGSVPMMAQPQRNYRFDPRVNQYQGDPKTYGQVDIGNFRFYEPVLKVS